MFRFLNILICLVCASRGLAQPDTLWTRTYGGTGDEFGRSIIQTSGGGYLVGAQVGGSPWSSGTLCLLKLDSNFDVTWQRTYDGISSGWACARQMTSGTYLVAAYTSLAEFSPDGDTLSVTSYLIPYAGFYHQSPECLQRTTNGQFVLAQFARIYHQWPPGEEQMLTVRRFDNAGTELWANSNSIGGGGLAIAELQSGAIASVSFRNSQYDPYYLNVRSSSGQTMAEAYFGGAVDSYFMPEGTLVALPGNCVATAVRWQLNGQSCVQLAKWNENLDTLWTEVWIPELWTEPISLVPAQNGDLVLGCQRLLQNEWQILAARFDSLGTLRWVIDYGGADDDLLSDIVALPDGFLLLGTTYSEGAGGADIYLLKVAGESPDASSNPPGPTPQQPILGAAYPNPFNPVTTLSFSLPVAGVVTLKVFDLTGREVSVLANRQYPAGEHSVTFDGSDLPSGIYFAHLSTYSRSITQKLLLVK